MEKFNLCGDYKSNYDKIVWMTDLGWFSRRIYHEATEECWILSEIGLMSNLIAIQDTDQLQNKLLAVHNYNYVGSVLEIGNRD